MTPDRAYCLSIRGLAREAATAYGVVFHDPAGVDPLPVDGDGHPGDIADPRAADRLVLRTVTGSTRGDGRRPGCSAGWCCAGCDRSPSPSTSPTT